MDIRDNKNHLRILVSAAAAYSVALASGWLLPKLVGEWISSYGMNEGAAGLVATAEMAALALTSMIGARVLTNVTYLRIISCGILLVCIGNFVSINTESYRSLIAIRILCGVGAGMLMMASSAAVADFADSDRAYGQINVVNVLTAIAAYAAAPIVFGFVTPPASYSIILIYSFLLLPFALLMPKNVGLSLSKQPEQNVECNNISLDTVLITIGVFVPCCILGAVWAFYFVLGERAGLLPDQIDSIMARTVAFALFGCALVSFIGHKYGRFGPLALGLMITAGAIMSLSLSSNAYVYQLCTGLNLLGLYIFIPYFLGYASIADPSGRGPAMVAGAYILGTAVGPYLGGIIFHSFGVEFLAWTVLISHSISLFLFYFVEHRQANRELRNEEWTPDLGRLP